MAKNHITFRTGGCLNLNSGKRFKAGNIYADGGLSAEDEAWLYAETEKSAEETMDAQKAEAAAARKAKLNSIASGVAGALPAIGTVYSAYNTLSGADTSKYDTALNTIPKSVSIGNYDALADWAATNPTLSNPTASDLDTMSTAGKIGTGLSTIASTTATGAQVGGWVGALAGLVGGAGAVGAGLLAGKKKRERLADEISRKNSLANQRLNSMYLHELGDIQEEMANQAYANLSAKGGKIHIAPSKRGTFKAQASRMGMSVQEAARHILANKNRYSPAMRKKAAFAKAAAGWKHEDGGDLDLFEFPVEYTHGGYFSLQPELIKINQGGTHEQNPLDGVPMGFDENGIPNLVEEGETIFDDYVFSNRLAPTEKQLAEGGLATKYKDHTFADISEKIAKQFEETPVDNIARESFKESMQRLKTIQEQVRSENAVSEAQQIPEQMVAPDSMEYTGQAPIEEEMPMEQMQEGVPQDMMEQVPMQPEMMQAYGGNLFVGGGDINKVNRKLAEMYAIASKAYNGNAYTEDEMRDMFAKALNNTDFSDFSDEERKMVMDVFDYASKRASAQNTNIFAGKNNLYYDADGNLSRSRNWDNVYRADKKNVSAKDLDSYRPNNDIPSDREIRDAQEKEVKKLAKQISDNSNGYFSQSDVIRYLKNKGTVTASSVGSRGTAINYPNLSSEGLFDDLISKHPVMKDAITGAVKSTLGTDYIGFNDEPVSTQGRKTDGVAGKTVNAGTGAGNSSARANTALYKEGTTAEQKRELWFNSSGKALVDSLNNAKKDWDARGLKGEELAKEQKAYVDAMNAVQQAYTKAYEAGYDPTTRTSNKDAAVRALQELWEQNKGNKYFNELVKGINTRGNSGDNSARGWIDGLWGDITRNRNWGLNEYFEDIKNLADKGDANAKQIYDSLKNAGITYTPEYDYGKNGYKAYKFGLQSDRRSMGEPIQQIETPAGSPLSPFKEQPSELAIQRPEVALTPEQERIQRKAQRQEARQERRAAREAQGLPTWMRYAPIAGSAISAIWDMAQKPDYSVAEAAERIASNTPRVRFNPIGNYLTYRPVDRNFYLNQIRNQALSTDRGILNASGANQGAATAGLLASQYNTQGAIGNSLMQQELANRQNEQQVAQFNRGTDQYNSQGLFNESIYNQRAGMHAGHYALTAAQLRQAERQRRNAAISADLTNLFQGIGDIGWENMNANMVNMNPALQYQINLRGNRNAGETTHKAKCGGMLTKKKSRRK